MKSFVRDDLEFLRHLPDHVESNTALVTLDVVNRYTIITARLGQEALCYWIEKCINNIDERFTTQFLTEPTDLVLKNNIFMFNDRYFHQVKGTAMGTKMATTYATLTLGYFEEMYHRICEKLGEEYHESIKMNWKRYLGDWGKEESNLTIVYNILNTLDPDIKFTMEKSSSEIPFLDVIVRINSNQICTDIFYKSNDTHQYLHFGSSHPIPYNLARRICIIIVSDEETRY